MKKIKVTFEIWDVSENEMLVDNLTFEDMVSQLADYQNFFGKAVVAPFYRTRENNKRKSVSTREDFTRDWLALMDELCKMDNIY